jgi:NAD(P)-dependent dehydrogenase (short-subunit alcohol dehydrogenase family)
MVVLMERLERGEIVSPAASREMIELMKREQNHFAIGRTLDVPMATKYGALDHLRSAIGIIYSTAGLGWEATLPLLNEYLDISDFDAAAQWAQEHTKTDYMWSKQAICAYVAREAMSFLKQGIRINAICPGPTDTPLAQANKDMWLGFGSDYRAEVGVETATPLEQAYPLVFLCSDAATAIAGQTMITDSGYFSAGMTEAFPDATPVVNFLLGRS